MELQDLWDQPENELPFTDLPLDQLTHKKSILPMEKLRKSLLAKSYWGFALALLYAGVALFTQIELLQTIIGSIAVIHGIMGGINYFTYQTMSKSLSADKALLDHAIHHKKMIVTILRLETYTIIAIFPALLFSSFLLGYTVSGKNMYNVFTIPYLYLYLASVAILTPLVIWFGNKLNKIAFGKDLQLLDQHIQLLKEGQ